MLSSILKSVRTNWVRWRRPLLAIALVMILAFAPASSAFARTGGRAGGSSFRSYRAPVTRTAPRTSNRAPAGGGGGYYGGGYGFGGGFGFPLFFPMFVGGGSGIFTFLIIAGVGTFAIRTIRSMREDRQDAALSNPDVAVTELQVGLLASARSLQEEIDRIALSSDPSDPAGLSKLLQEVSLQLVRHDDYWVYGNLGSETLKLNAAEQRINQLSLQERSKFSSESLTNIEGRISQGDTPKALEGDEVDLSNATEFSDVGEYLVVTLLVAAEGKSSTLPVVDSAESLRRCLMQLGAVPAERLLAMEVLWTPQASGDTLTATELMTEYPQLQLL